MHTLSHKLIDDEAEPKFLLSSSIQRIHGLGRIFQCQWHVHLALSTIIRAECIEEFTWKPLILRNRPLSLEAHSDTGATDSIRCPKVAKILAI